MKEIKIIIDKEFIFYIIYNTFFMCLTHQFKFRSYKNIEITVINMACHKKKKWNCGSCKTAIVKGSDEFMAIFRKR